MNARCCSYDQEGRRLAIGNPNGSIDIFDFKSQTSRRRQLKSTIESPLDCISWSKNDRFIGCGSSDGSVVLFNTLLNTVTKPMRPPSHNRRNNGNISNNNTNNNACTDIFFSPLHPSNLASSYADGSVIIWDVNKEASSLEFHDHDMNCTCVVFSPINKMLAVSGGLDSKINIYDTTKKKYSTLKYLLYCETDNSEKSIFFQSINHYWSLKR